MEPLLITDDLDGNQGAILVINTPDNLAEASLPEDVNDLIAVCKMISRYNGVVAAFVIVAKIGYVRVEVPYNLGSVLCAAKVDVVVIYDLTTLIDVQHGDAYGFLRADTLLWSRTLPKRIQSPCSHLRLLAPSTKFLHLVFSSQVVPVEIRSPNIELPERAGGSFGLHRLVHDRWVMRPLHNRAQTRIFLSIDKVFTSVPLRVGWGHGLQA